MTMSPIAKTVCLLSLTLLACCCTGCQLPFVLAEMAFPNEKIKSEYTLPKDKSVLVFPDDMTNPVSYPPIKRELAEKINEYFRQNKLTGEVIPYQRLADLQADDANFNRMSVGTVGRKLGADYVIYINIERFDLKESPTDTIWHANLEGRVRVVDSHTGQRTWPDESAGFPFKCGMPTTDNASPGFGGVLTKALCNKAGTEICYLFDSHEERRSRPKEKETELDH